MSRFLSEPDVLAIQRYLSTPRLGTFEALTRSGTSEDAIELHQATMSLGISIAAVTGLLEVALRNAACIQLSAALGRDDWLRSPMPDFNWSEFERGAIKKAEGQARRAAYSKKSGPDKAVLDVLAYPAGKPQGLSHTAVVKKRQSVITVTDGQIVAQLTMHFWKRLFGQEYEAKLWKRALKKTFPNKELSRADIAEKLEVIYEVRNRLAHHEPVYGVRLDNILIAIEFVALNLGVPKPSMNNPFYKLILPQLDILAGQVAIFRATFTRLTL